MSEQVADAIRRAIRDHGPISWAEFMERALYGPGGYYERPPVGPAGDFVTSPHVHPVFGALLATAVRELAAALGDPVPLRLAEVGAGDGTLATTLLDALADLDVDYRAIDTSDGARSALAGIARLGKVATELDGTPHVVLANELLDNLPFRRLRGDREVRIGLDGQRLVEMEVPWGVAPAPHEGELIVPEGAFAFIDRLASVLTRGYAVLIDYGAVGSAGGDVHGYRDHRVVENLLDAPGSTDITVGMDFAVISRHAEERGLTAFPSTTQHDALRSLGFEGWLRDELDRQRRLLDEREGLEAVRAWSGRSRATLLVDPSALGRLRWLVLASPGLPAPSWLGGRGGDDD